MKTIAQKMYPVSKFSDCSISAPLPEKDLKELNRTKKMSWVNQLIFSNQQQQVVEAHILTKAAVKYVSLSAVLCA